MTVTQPFTLDDFEEFFSLYERGKDGNGELAKSRDLFLKNLLYPSTAWDSRVLVLLTMLILVAGVLLLLVHTETVVASGVALVVVCVVMSFAGTRSMLASFVLISPEMKYR